MHENFEFRNLRQRRSSFLLTSECIFVLPW